MAENKINYEEGINETEKIRKQLALKSLRHCSNDELFKELFLEIKQEIDEKPDSDSESDSKKYDCLHS